MWKDSTFLYHYFYVHRFLVILILQLFTQSLGFSSSQDITLLHWLTVDGDDDAAAADIWEHLSCQLHEVHANSVSYDMNEIRQDLLNEVGC